MKTIEINNTNRNYAEYDDGNFSIIEWQEKEIYLHGFRDWLYTSLGFTDCNRKKPFELPEEDLLRQIFAAAESQDAKCILMGKKEGSPFIVDPYGVTEGFAIEGSDFLRFITQEDIEEEPNLVLHIMTPAIPPAMMTMTKVERLWLDGPLPGLKEIKIGDEELVLRISKKGKGEVWRKNSPKYGRAIISIVTEEGFPLGYGKTEIPDELGIYRMELDVDELPSKFVVRIDELEENEEGAAFNTTTHVVEVDWNA